MVTLKRDYICKSSIYEIALRGVTFKTSLANETVERKWGGQRRKLRIKKDETRVTTSDPEFQILELRRRNTRISQCKMLGIRRKSRDSRTPGVCQILGMNRSSNCV